MGFCLLSVTGLVFWPYRNTQSETSFHFVFQFNSNLVFQYNTYSGPSTPKPWIIQELRVFVVGRIAIFSSAIAAATSRIVWLRCRFADRGLPTASGLLGQSVCLLANKVPQLFAACPDAPLPVYSRSPNMISPPACPQACGPRPS